MLICTVPGIYWKICSVLKWKLLLQIHVEDKLLDQNGRNFDTKKCQYILFKTGSILNTWLLAPMSKSLTESDHSAGWSSRLNLGRDEWFKNANICFFDRKMTNDQRTFARKSSSLQSSSWVFKFLNSNLNLCVVFLS